MRPENNEGNVKKCICRGCPLYSDCTRSQGEALFCARGKSECALDGNKICICGSCEVYSENQLNGGYFCLRGAAE